MRRAVVNELLHTTSPPFYFQDVLYWVGFVAKMPSTIRPFLGYICLTCGPKVKFLSRIIPKYFSSVLGKIFVSNAPTTALQYSLVFAIPSFYYAHDLKIFSQMNTLFDQFNMQLDLSHLHTYVSSILQIHYF